MYLFQTAQAYVQLFEKSVKSIKSKIEEIGTDNGKKAASALESWKYLTSDLEALLENANKVSSSLSHCLTIFIQQEEVCKFAQSFNPQTLIFEYLCIKSKYSYIQLSVQNGFLNGSIIKLSIDQK